MKTLKIDELNRLYDKSEECDKSTFNEFKSNVLLVSGNHYHKQDVPHRDRLNGGLASEKTKVRITKNMMPKITSRIIDGIMGLSPEVKCTPANKTERSDRKSAELYESVRQFMRKRYKLEEKKEDWCADFVEISEVAVKIYWDPNKGDLRGYQQAVSDEGLPLFKDKNGQVTVEPAFKDYQRDAMGMPMMDPMTGQPVIQETPHEMLPDESKPIFSGDFCYETIFPADLLRDPEAETMDDSPYLTIRKMIDVDKAKRLVAEDDPEREDKLKFIQKSSETNFKVFDQNTHTFEDSKGRVLIKETYFRPCYDYPRGYFYVFTELGILSEGELPFGEWNIAWRPYKKTQTKPRGTGVVKVARPWQVELNRASSKEIENQLVHGDDKIITPPGAKIAQEATLPGIRQFKALGAPTVIPGRTGEQYRPYIDATKEELFFAISEEIAPEPTQQDPMAIYYRGLKRKEKYGRPAKEFQAFIEEVYWISLKLAKHYYDDQWVIRAVGRREQINLAEFRNSDPLDVMISLEGSNTDAESQLGQMLFLQMILQYAGKELPKGALGKLISFLPMANTQGIIAELNGTSQNIENDLLALDRGQMRPAEPDDDHPKYIEALTSAIKSPDFEFKDPQIQELYKMKREEHRNFEAEQAKALAQAEQGFIPMTGNLCKVDQYIMQDGKQVRLTLPNDAITWLKEKLDQQGMTQERLDVLSQADKISILSQATQGQQMNQPQVHGGTNGNGINPVN